MKATSWCAAPRSGAEGEVLSRNSLYSLGLADALSYKSFTDAASRVTTYQYDLAGTTKMSLLMLAVYRRQRQVSFPLYLCVDGTGKHQRQWRRHQLILYNDPGSANLPSSAIRLSPNRT